MGRTEELAALLAWCENEAAAPVRLITGPGGVGKTRLGLRLAEQLEGLGWRCWWVRSGREHIAVAHARAATLGPALLVVDSAETRTGLASLLRTVAADSGPPLRVLLLARQVGHWWESLGAGEPAVRELIAAAGADGDMLGPVLDMYLRDEEVVQTAVTCFARELGVDPPQRVAIASGGRRARVLEWHAAALVAVLNVVDGHPGPVELFRAVDELLRHEESFWTQTAQGLGLLDSSATATPAALRQVVAAGSLLGAADEQEVLALLGRITGVSPSGQLAAWLRRLYPPAQDSGDWLGMMEPGLLAEQLVAAELRASPVFAQQCLTGLTEPQARRALVLLAHVAAEHDEIARFLEMLLPQLTVSLECLIAVADALPYPSEQLAGAYSAIVRRVLGMLPEDAYPAEHAWWLSRLAATLAAAGQPAEAVPLMEKAVSIYRTVVTRIRGYEQELAASLAELGDYLADLEQAADALAPVQDALAIRRELADADPDRYAADLAGSLSALVRLLAEAGRPLEALPFSQEAVELCRELAAASPQLYRPQLARALVNLAATLTHLGKPGDALPAAEEAARVCRELAAGSPELYQPDLARSLANLGAILSQVGRPQDALPFAEEALTIRRDLAAASPQRNGSDLAHSLVNLGGLLSKLGRGAEAEEILAEARELTGADTLARSQ